MTNGMHEGDERSNNDDRPWARGQVYHRWRRACTARGWSRFRSAPSETDALHGHICTEAHAQTHTQTPHARTHHTERDTDTKQTISFRGGRPARLRASQPSHRSKSLHTKQQKRVPRIGCMPQWSHVIGTCRWNPNTIREIEGNKKTYRL